MPETDCGPKGSTPGQRFDQLVEAYYRAWFRYHPEAAVEAGVEGYAHLLTPYGDDDIGALVSLNEKLLDALEELERDALDPQRRLDYEVLYGAALIEIHQLRESDWRYHDPGRFLPLEALNQLLLRPVANFAEALRARLSLIPEYLRGARAPLSQTPELVPILWLEAALRSAEAGVDFIRELDQHPKVRQAVTRIDSLREPLDAAVHALQEFQRFLETDIAPRAEGDFACGRTQFERLLRYRHGLDIGVDALERFGQGLLETTERDLKDACRALRGDEDIGAALADIQAEHPSAEDLLDAYRRSMREAHDFVQQHDLVSLPAQQQLKVVETPVFLRHLIPFAAYVEPAVSDPEQCGYYYVTPVSGEALGEHNRLSIAHTSVHEAWPGHHVQFVTANAGYASRSLVRRLNPSSTLYEGWALYCESMMHEHGFLAGPRSRLVLLRDRLWRALRVVLDVGLHTRGLSVDLAAERMIDTLGFGYSQAMAELSWYSMAPTTPQGYALGWALIEATRDRLRLTEPGFGDKSFHDRLLAGGSVGLPWVIAQQFGEGTWRSVSAMLFERPGAAPGNH